MTIDFVASPFQLSYRSRVATLDVMIAQGKSKILNNRRRVALILFLYPSLSKKCIPSEHQSIYVISLDKQIMSKKLPYNFTFYIQLITSTSAQFILMRIIRRVEVRLVRHFDKFRSFCTCHCKEDVLRKAGGFILKCINRLLQVGRVLLFWLCFIINLFCTSDRLC